MSDVQRAHRSRYPARVRSFHLLFRIGAPGTLVMILLTTLLRAQPIMPAAPAHLTETGVPPFAVYSPDTLGLGSAPTDLKFLPDGRLVVVAQGDIAFGDGARWHTIPAAQGQPPFERDIAVDDSGNIYFGIEGAIGRLQLLPNGTWTAESVAPLPDDPQVRQKTMLAVRPVGQEWVWNSGSGHLVLWRPGQAPRLLPNRVGPEHVFEVNGEIFVSDTASGGLYCVTRSPDALVPGFDANISQRITCSAPFAPGKVLVGTSAMGLRLFDGERFERFGDGSLLGGSARVNDLRVVGDHFVAAIDNLGIVFFNRAGRTLQVLDARLDHRLTRVERLRYANGALWAVLNEGLARVEYPSPVSRYEPLIPTGVTYVRPVRHEGRLWMQADGRVFAGEYDPAGRLRRFAPAPVPGRFTFTLDAVDGDLFAGSDEGLFVRREDRWQPVVESAINARIVPGQFANGARLYVARREMGWIRKQGDTFAIERISAPPLGDNYNAWVDGRGIVWLELGNQRIGRIEPTVVPKLEIFGAEHGLRDGWVGIFIMEGTAHFQQPAHTLRFDEVEQRFVDDSEFLRRFPDLVWPGGRPVIDARNVVWYAKNGGVWTIDLSQPNPVRKAVAVPFVPFDLRFEADGVGWLFGDRKMARYDTRVEPAVAFRPRVVVTAVHFPTTGRQVFTPNGLPPIEYADNTVAFSFMSPGAPLATPVTYEVQLGGHSDQWLTVGTTGQSVFNRLKEGSYVFRVRAQTSLREPGEEARVAFTILPPWYRTSLAWAAYGVTGAALLGLGLWYPSARQRRNNALLERLVQARTAELGRQMQATEEKSRALATSEERYRSLSSQLERRVDERTAELAATYKELVSASRLAGMAEVATGVLHNVGNVLNSINVSANLLLEAVRQSRMKSLTSLNQLFESQANDLPDFFARDPRAKLVPELLKKLDEHSRDERDWLLQELQLVQKNIDHVKEVVAMQQSYATVHGVTETVDPRTLFEDTLRMNSGTLGAHNIRIARDYRPTSKVVVEKAKVLQILTNLIRNAQHACDDAPSEPPREKVITVALDEVGGRVRFVVQDTGIGIAPENLTRIFAHGFTTRAYGHGFGLHASALAAREMKGALTAESAGVGHGATFVLEIPAATAAPDTAAP